MRTALGRTGESEAKEERRNEGKGNVAKEYAEGKFKTVGWL